MKEKHKELHEAKTHLNPLQLSPQMAEQKSVTAQGWLLRTDERNLCLLDPRGRCRLMGVDKINLGLPDPEGGAGIDPAALTRKLMDAVPVADLVI